jgi:hypothetical protein
MGNDLLFRNVSRRDFLKKAGQTAVALGGLELIACRTTQGPKTDVSRQGQTVVYPPLKGHKIQPPENGCLVGFRSRKVSEPIENILGRKPFLEVFYEDLPSTSFIFPIKWAENPARQGITPFFFATIGRKGLTDFVNGKDDKIFQNYAEEAAEYGEKYGPFFFGTMEEMNAPWWPWGQSSKFVAAWKRAWDIFERAGVNKYATWVWEPYCIDAAPKVDYPDRYYPGDEYVDWIGLSAYNMQKYPTSHLSFEAMVYGTYNDMLKRHPTKPIMQAEFGKTNIPDQARWLKNAYQAIKSMPGMKAANYYAIINVGEGDDSTLNKESVEVLKEVLKDPYWIMAK